MPALRRQVRLSRNSLAFRSRCGGVPGNMRIVKLRPDAQV